MAGCTPDNLLSARCMLTTWGGGSSNAQAPDPLLYEPGSGSSWNDLSPSEVGEVLGTGNIPEVFNYLGDTDATDGITAGCVQPLRTDGGARGGCSQWVVLFWF